MKLTEDNLCRAFADKARTSPEFTSWLLGQTKFAESRSQARLLHEEQVWRRPHVSAERWWRHWWCNIPALSEQRETDIFLVFEVTGSSKRFALHIENKQGGRFRPGQAEAYEPRARFMMNTERSLNYTDFQTVMIAPLAFRANNRAKSDVFGCYIPYEDVATFIPEFGGYTREAPVAALP
jgi:hypothetical protein